MVDFMNKFYFQSVSKLEEESLTKIIWIKLKMLTHHAQNNGIHTLCL